MDTGVAPKGTGAAWVGRGPHQERVRCGKCWSRRELTGQGAAVHGPVNQQAGAGQG